MAVTKIHAIKATVKKALDYIMNEEKTQGKMLVSGVGCTPETADLEFMFSSNLAESLNGKTANIGGGNNLAYHMIQSFSKADAIVPEQAHALGLEWGSQVLDGRHDFVIATHIDKGHIHNHIIFNAYTNDDFKKFRSQPFKTAQKIRDLSDKLCQEQGLYVIENPVTPGQKRKEYEARKAGESWKQKIQTAIDKVIPQVADYAEFKESLSGLGINIKEGKYLSFGFDGQDRRVRANGKGLSFEYSKETITARINAIQKQNITVASITAKLVEEGSTTFMTRIPYTSSYVRFGKDVSFWHKSGRAIGAAVQHNQVYDVLDRRGQVISQISGLELAKHYSAFNNNHITKETAKKRVMGAVGSAPGITMPYEIRSMRMIRSRNLEKIKEMAAALRVSHAEGVVQKSEFDTRIGQIKAQMTMIKADKLTPIEEKGAKLREFAGWLVTYNKGLPIKEEIEKAPPWKKEGLRKRYAMDISAFEYAAAKIKDMGIDVNTDETSVMKGLRDIQQIKGSIQQDLQALEVRVQKLQNAQRVFNDAITNIDAKTSIIEIGAEKKVYRGQAL